MSERIVVCCNNKEAHDEVQKKAFTEGYGWGYGGKKTLSNHWQEIIPKIYLFLYSKDNDMTFSHSKPSDDAIISASEYLQEFKVGDRVECIDGKGRSGDWSLIEGKIYKISGVSSDLVYLDSATDKLYIKERFKLATKQTKPKKENDMKINQSIRKVFTGDTFELVEAMQENFGTEIAETFTGEINLKRDKKLYIAELTRREEEARKAAEAK